MIPALQKAVVPYLDIEGIEAAALVSTDGLLITWVGDAVANPEAIAANAASALASISTLAAEMGTALPRFLRLGLPDRDLILAPLTGDLALVLLGRDEAIGNLAGRGPA